jgi:hypothetical protein
MNVTFNPNHYFRMREFSRYRRVSLTLTVIPFTINLRERVDIVRYGVGIDNLQNLSRLNAD